MPYDHQLRRRPRRGFSLIELAVVLIVIGVIAAIAIPTFQGVIDRSEQAAAVREQEAIGREVMVLVAMGETYEDALLAAVADTSAAAPGVWAAQKWTAVDETTPDLDDPDVGELRYIVADDDDSIGWVAYHDTDASVSCLGEGSAADCWLGGPDATAAEALDGNPDGGGLPGGGLPGGGLPGGGLPGGGPAVPMPVECGVADELDTIDDAKVVTVNLADLATGNSALRANYAAGLDAGPCVDAASYVHMDSPEFSIDGGATWMSLWAFSGVLQAAEQSSDPYVPGDPAIEGAPWAAQLQRYSVAMLVGGDAYDRLEIIHWGGGVITASLPLDMPWAPMIRSTFRLFDSGGYDWVTHTVTLSTTTFGASDPSSTRPFGLTSVELQAGDGFTSPDNYALAAELGGPELQLLSSADNYSRYSNGAWGQHSGLWTVWPGTATTTDPDGKVTFTLSGSSLDPQTHEITINPVTGRMTASSGINPYHLDTASSILTSALKCDDGGACRVINIKVLRPS